jgi:type VI secretion system (T6SS) effector TldE1-like protein
MTDATAALYGVTAFDDRVDSLGAGRRIIRSVFDGVVIGIGAAAAVGALACAVAGAAIWIVSTALATHPHLNERALIGPAALALADPALAFPGAADMTGTIAASIEPDHAPTFEQQWSAGRATDSARPVSVVRVLPPPVERASKLASLLAVAPAAPAVVPPLAVSPVAGPPVVASLEKRVALPETRAKSSLPEPDSHTAVYDISAHTVYLPNGEKLEAHSGLGDKLDDPRYVNLRDRGPTPPNVYELALRGELFHEVRALRLNPVGGDSMFGRDGILAHTYMLGPNGQSNGCVSFKDYPAFLHAYLRGEVDRLVVVPHLGNTSWRTASAHGPARADASKNP